MSPPTITSKPVPTGGVISLVINGAVSGTATLERAVSGQAFSTIYSGSPTPFYVDVGDGQPAPLDPTLYYQYRYTDASGVVLSPFINPACQLVYEPDPITQILIRVFQGLVNSLKRPAGIQPVQVTHAMPLGGNIKLPLIVINLDLAHQAAVPIGQSIATLPAVLSAATGVPASGFAITGFANRTYRVSILATDANTRDFYRDVLIAAFEAIYGPILQPMGMDITHKWQASSGQTSNDRQGMTPGFYFADVIMEFEGTLNVVVNLAPPIIGTIDLTVLGVQQGSPLGATPTVDQIEVPAPNG